MENENTSDTFLAQWLAGQITDEQLREKVSSADFEAYIKLRSSLDSLELPSTDLEANYAAVKSKKINALDRKSRPKVISLYRIAAVAASVLVLFGLYNLFVFSNAIQTAAGQSTNVTLADNSVVSLNAKSNVSYPNFFALNRVLELDGEAFFDVSSGSKFTVRTSAGDVEVLGTKFNVIARDGVFEIVCHEGKVQVCTNSVAKILLPGNAIRFYGNETENWQITPTSKPAWAQQESAFRKMPLAYVIGELENQYDAQIDFPDALKTIRFTGSFTHQDLETALQSVCIPMQLRYTHSNGKIVISQ